MSYYVRKTLHNFTICVSGVVKRWQNLNTDFS